MDIFHHIFVFVFNLDLICPYAVSTYWLTNWFSFRMANGSRSFYDVEQWIEKNAPHIRMFVIAFQSSTCRRFLTIFLLYRLFHHICFDLCASVSYTVVTHINHTCAYKYSSSTSPSSSLVGYQIQNNTEMDFYSHLPMYLYSVCICSTHP